MVLSDAIPGRFELVRHGERDSSIRAVTWMLSPPTFAKPCRTRTAETPLGIGCGAGQRLVFAHLREGLVRALDHACRNPRLAVKGIQA